MADGTGAAALFPNLPSEAALESRAPTASDRLGAASVYGSPEGGAARAREIMNGGIAEPGSAPRSEPAARGWLAELTDRGDSDVDRHRDNDVDRGGETHISAPYDARSLGIEGPLADDFVALAAGEKMSPRGAKEMVALYEEAKVADSISYWSKQASDWERESQRQFGPRLEAMANEIKPLLDDPRLTPPEFKTLLGQFGLGNHPAVIGLLSRWGAAIRGGRR